MSGFSLHQSSLACQNKITTSDSSSSSATIFWVSRSASFSYELLHGSLWILYLFSWCAVLFCYIWCQYLVHFYILDFGLWLIKMQLPLVSFILNFILLLEYLFSSNLLFINPKHLLSFMSLLFFFFCVPCFVAVLRSNLSNKWTFWMEFIWFSMFKMLTQMSA